MTRIATANYFARNMASLQLRQSNLDRAQMELSTGKQIIKPSDDPTGSNSMIRLRQEIEVSNRYIVSQESAERFNLTSESAVASMTDVIFRAEELMLQSINGTMDKNSLAAIAEELQQRLEQFEGLTNTTNANGDFIFSGFQTNTQTYEVDDFGYRQYQGDSGQREVLIAAGFKVKVGDPASQFIENVPSTSASYVPTANAANLSSSSISMGFVTQSAEYERAAQNAPFTVNFIAGAGAGQVRVEVLDNGGAAIPLEPNKSNFLDITPGDKVQFNGIEFSTQANPAPVAGDSFQFDSSSNTSVMWTLQRAIDAMGMVSSSYTGSPDITNASTATLTGGNIVDPAVGHTIDDFTVNILAGGLYEVYDSAGSLVEGPSDYTNDNKVTFNGVEFDVGGVPAAGDVFHIDRPDSQARTDLVSDLLTELKSGLTTVDNTRSSMGARLNAIEVEMSAQYRFQEVTKSTLANIEEIDIYEAITNLEMSKTGLQASQQSFAMMQKLSLFDYI
ncbi:flagellar hook-associated protein FlgL [Psychrosphaera sp. F3M07]|uniref:flagellar hook-associated protein FlgL n=1 Tax=Psychrosphaera sp. F3M07 TaxID=2841560 RepID=UPI001C09735C|nr:flagellar hook-associated protein FlgL [Psychrosphaera sp. F3M07]MBU2917470.1 flagellar hook-associated protein FlgL [Psychrosphaera sp. F3M07]